MNQSNQICYSLGNQLVLQHLSSSTLPAKDPEPKPGSPIPEPDVPFPPDQTPVEPVKDPNPVIPEQFPHK
jgi:hypothetical protein